MPAPQTEIASPSTTSIHSSVSCSRAVWLEMAPLSPGRGDNSDNAASWLPQAPGSTLNGSTLNGFTGQREASEQPPDFSHVCLPPSVQRNFEEILEQLSHTPIDVTSQGRSDLEGTTGESHSFTLVEERQDQVVNTLDQATLDIPVDEADVNQGHGSGYHTL
ncbi:hypothetical protein N8T08_005899 [Aspergillus melleus]|uniref:Uncharacterized protein n=1 Tax=Aspergillus melleus TaxID=138277 RepID=A0ACC3B1N8_9EURO|nr:hypothetical protein N8T08_005899 [Aspergillus melleus]